jgi:hypothetical protein
MIQNYSNSIPALAAFLGYTDQASAQILVERKSINPSGVK